MTARTKFFMVAATHDKSNDACLVRAMAAEWRRMHPHHTAGHIASKIGITKKAAANLLEGHLSATSLAKIIAAYGPFWVAQRVLEAANTNLEQFVDKQAEEALRAAARAEERALELEALRTRLRAPGRSDPGRDRALP